MSASTKSDHPAAASKPKKNKKKKAKSPVTVKPEEGSSRANGHHPTGDEEDEEDDGADAEEQTAETGTDGNSHNDLSNGSLRDQHEEIEEEEKEAEDEDDDTSRRLEAAAKERDELRKQVTELRQELEGLSRQHEEELAGLKPKLDSAQNGREIAESKYQKLLGQVNTIKTQLGERLKADAADLAQAREHISHLELEKQSRDEESETLKSELSNLKTASERQLEELSGLRGRTNLSQQNWAKERDDLARREAQAREEFETARQAMQDWEVIATEGRSVREGLSDRVAELEEQLSSLKEAYEKVAEERDSQSQTVDALQRALQEIHDARKQERRELVESSQSQLDDLRKALQKAEEIASASQAELESSKSELERALPFEKEVKEKNLLIGKLRHEAVILNDHLTKALRFLRKGKPEDNVDRQLVTNHFMQFLALDRSDPKKFQVLQLISALLGWTEEQNEAAGLQRPGASTSTNIRVPLSGPFRRVSSTATLNPIGSPQIPFSPDLASPRAANESLAELWSDFLEREAEEGAKGRRSSRPSSAASTPRGPGPSSFFAPPANASPRGSKGADSSIREEAEGST